MTRISSNSSYKYVGSVIWLVVMAFTTATALLSGAVENVPLFSIIACLAALAGFFLFWKLEDWLWNVADEVYDGGDFLVVRYRGEEENVPLSDIASVIVTNRPFTKAPARIMLRLAHPGRFGGKIVFWPKTTIDDNLLATSKVGEDLIVRVNKARSRSAA
jgi:hypothetical protein